MVLSLPPTRAGAGWRRIAGVALALLGVARGFAATPVPARPAETSATLALERLPADPALRLEPLRRLQERRLKLAMSEGSFADFVEAAMDTEAMGADYAAAELLWFADKLTTDTRQRDAVGRRMQDAIRRARRHEPAIESARQQADAGRLDEAQQALEGLVGLDPYCELGYFELARLAMRHYRRLAGAPTDPLPPLEARVRLFAEGYERLKCTLAIDPLFLDAWYELSRLRDLLSDQPQWLQRTEPLSRQAAAFIGEVAPRIDAVDRGERSAALFEAISRALEQAGCLEYALFAAHAARAQPDATQAQVEALRRRIGMLRATLARQPAGDASPPPTPREASPGRSNRPKS